MRIVISGIPIDVQKKNIKNMHLQVKPPDGHVVISAPLSVDDKAIEAYARTQLGFIKRAIAQFQEQPRASRRQYVSGETMYIWGKQYFLVFKSDNQKNSFEIQNQNIVLSMSAKSTVKQRDAYVKEEYRKILKEEIENYSSEGYRVLVFGKYDGEINGKELTENATPIAFILLNNAIREGAMDTFRYFSKRGVEVKVISGDNPVTVSEIAKKAGIRHAEKQVDAATLKTAEAVRKAAKKYTVFGRVTPEQKRLLVQALKEQGKTVAMTGDGVNDILALKDADCSIAMASGSEAASHVAQLVLLDNDFNKMPAVVMEGRRVVNNIGRTASLYLVKNIFSMLLAVFSMLFLIDYPLEPSQVSLISVFTIGIPSFFLALEQNRNQIHGHFLTNVLIQALPAGITDFIVVSGLVIFCREFGVEKECVSTSCTILIAVVGFMILYHIAKPMTTPHAILIAAMVIGWLFCMLFFSELFAITAVTGKCAMLMIVFAVITEPVFRYLIQLVETVQKWGGKLKF